MAKEVHVELAAEVLERDELERTGHRDPGVVHEPRKPGGARAVLDRAARGLDRLRVGHVDDEGHKPPGRVGAQALAVLGSPYAREDIEPGCGEMERARTPDAGRAPCDYDGAPCHEAAEFKVSRSAGDAVRSLSGHRG